MYSIVQREGKGDVRVACVEREMMPAVTCKHVERELCGSAKHYTLDLLFVEPLISNVLSFRRCWEIEEVE